MINGVRMDSLYILEKGWGVLHHYVNDRWYQSRYVVDFGEGLGSSSPQSQ
jgi:hypothetical protein